MTIKLLPIYKKEDNSIIIIRIPILISWLSYTYTYRNKLLSNLCYSYSIPDHLLTVVL